MRPDQPKLARFPAWDGFVPEWIDERGSVWLSRSNVVYRASKYGAAPERVGAVPISSVKALLARSSYAQRLLRLSFYNVVPLANGRIFATYGHELFVLEGNKAHAITGVRRPFRVLRGGCAVTPSGDIFFGEYFPNRDRAEPVAIYRIGAGTAKAEVVFEFAPGEVRHVHSVRFDAVTGDLWTCTGDLPSECRVLRTSDSFGSLQTVGSGDETWRAISPQFTKEAVFYATDSEFADNAIYRIDRTTNARTTVCEIDGPSYYGAQCKDLVLFATTAELCPSQKEKAAALWAIDESGAVRVRSWAKDLWGLKPLVGVFQPGVVQFPSGAASDIAIFTGSGLRNLRGRMFAAGHVDALSRVGASSIAG